jgi:SSS family solute:Na+ symporter
VKEFQARERSIADSVRQSIARAVPEAKASDTDYVFLNFVLSHLPHGIIGLLLAVMFSAAMSSMAGELSALASTTTVDIYKRNFNKEASSLHYLMASRLFTVMWALLAMLFALLANFAENLIQFVNIVGSLFYGTILGIFLTAFYFKKIKGTAVFLAAIVSEIAIFSLYFFTDVAFLLYNMIGCAIVIGLSWVIQWEIDTSEKLTTKK